jgi:hypothetical protein
MRPLVEAICGLLGGALLLVGTSRGQLVGVVLIAIAILLVLTDRQEAQR